MRINTTQFPPQDPFGIGFDRIFDRMHTLNTLQTKQTNYPPYNIIKKGDNLYEVEIAVAGFLKSEITIELEDGVMTVTGKRAPLNDGIDFIHKGIAERDFTRKFTLADTIEVCGADLHSGILTIVLENVIPEHKKPRTIEIGKGETQQFLTESE